jgi:hypothetical protein
MKNPYKLSQLMSNLTRRTKINHQFQPLSSKKHGTMGNQSFKRYLSLRIRSSLNPSSWTRNQQVVRIMANSLAIRSLIMKRSLIKRSLSKKNQWLKNHRKVL